MAHPSPTRSALGTTLLVLVLALAGIAAPAAAQQASLTLSRDVALWSDAVVALIQGVGCTGPANLSSIDAGLITIDLQGCSAGSTAPFATTFELFPLYPGEYTVRVRDAAHTSQPLDTAPLTVHPSANLEVEVPGVPTDDAPVTLVFKGLSQSLCYEFDPPVVEGHVISARFFDGCPILPLPGPVVFENHHEVGPLPAGEYEVRFFGGPEEPFFTIPSLARTTFTVHDADRCVPSDTALCLQGGRFKVEAAWEDFAGHEGVGHPLPLAQGDDGSGLLWFFEPDNVELTVKVLNGCTPTGGHWWVFLSSGSTVRFTVTVTDTQTGAHKAYSNASGEQAPLKADVKAFACP